MQLSKSVSANILATINSVRVMGSLLDLGRCFIASLIDNKLYQDCRIINWVYFVKLALSIQWTDQLFFIKCSTLYDTRSPTETASFLLRSVSDISEPSDWDLITLL